MQDFIEIRGGNTLRGVVTAGGAKNAALPLLIASLLTADRCTFTNVPDLEDVSLTLHLLRTFGAEAEYHDGRVTIATPELVATEASYSLVKALRASFWVLAPLLARGGAARVALPGGDIIGARPVDMHVEALGRMGADVAVRHGVVFASAPGGLRPAEISLRYPSVGATHQVLMAASLVPGRTVLRGAACEPEVAALCDMLAAMGAAIEGAGTPDIVVNGRERLAGAEVRLIGDRLEAGTYLLAGLATGGRVRVEGVDPAHLPGFLDVVRETGATVLEGGVREGGGFVEAYRDGPVRPARVVTAPFPGLATDLQAPLMAYLALAEGTSTIEETVFDGRFGHVSELCRMGASITVRDRTATVRGVPRLSSAEVEGRDIRAAASLVIAGLAAEGVTRINEPHHLRRGYEALERKLGAIGGEARSKTADPHDYLFTGC